MPIPTAFNLSLFRRFPLLALALILSLKALMLSLLMGSNGAKAASMKTLSAIVGAMAMAMTSGTRWNTKSAKFSDENLH